MKFHIASDRRIFLQDTKSRNCCLFWSFHLCFRLAYEKVNGSFSYIVWPDSIDKYSAGHYCVKIDPSIMTGKEK